MMRLAFNRLIGGIVVLFFVANFAFWVIRLAPGGPFDDEKRFPPEIERNIKKAYDLDKPLLTQYGLYLKRLVTFDLGPSTKRTATVNEIISDSWPVSVNIGILALAFALVGGIFFGVVAASKQNTWLDHGSMGFALFGISMPAFVLGPLLILLFSINLRWLPPARYDGFATMILPAMTLGMIFMGVIARLTRTGLLETIRQDYIRTARAKGLSERKVVWKHAFRLGLLPVVTYLGPAIAALITGSFVVEQIFQLPGLGFYFIASVTDRDYPVLAGVLVFYSAFLIVLNFLVDIAYGFIDPRIRETRP